MNFVPISIYFKKCINKVIRIIILTFITLQVFLFLSGCGDNVKLPSQSELAEFEMASPAIPTIDFDRLKEIQINSNPYRVKPEEVLEITMPSILRVVSTEESIYTNQDDTYICRINENGNITLPVIGEISVAGKNLAQIENDIIQVYYPKYISSRPSVFVKIIEYKTFKVSISGAVETPGVYSLRSDQMSLVSLLMEAGGIIDEGAALIKINHLKGNNSLNYMKNTEIITKNENKQLLEPVINKASDSYSVKSNIDQIEVELKFKRLSKKSMKGILTITHDDEILFAEQVDISQKIERLLTLKQFSMQEPRVSIRNIEQNLYELAELLKPGSSNLSENNVAYNKILNEIEDERRNNLVLLYGKTTEQEQGGFAYAQQNPVKSDTSSLEENLLYNSVKKYSNNSRITDAALNPLQYQIGSVTEARANQRISGTFNLAQNTGDMNKLSSHVPQNSESIILPVKGFNIPFTDIALQDGDKIVVERLTIPLFSVVGLVNKPGNYSYPPDVRYNLMQALAFAGGLDKTSEPHYATIYRLNAEGNICHASFEIIKNKNSAQLTEALNIQIKPGDIVSIEHTKRTRKNVFLERVLRFNIGTYFNLNDTFDGE